MNEVGMTESEEVHNRALIRHCLATIAYRGSKALRDAPETFPSFQAGGGSRTPAQILAHMGDLLEWTLCVAEGGETWRSAWHPVAPSVWSDDVNRFFEALERVDAFFAAAKSCAMAPEILFQGPISDALTHIGQLAMLRRIAGAPVRGEVMILSDVQIGRVGLDQAVPKREFD